MINMPGMSKLGGITDRPILTIAALPPISEVTVENAPASSKINPKFTMPELPACSVKICTFFVNAVFLS